MQPQTKEAQKLLEQITAANLPEEQKKHLLALLERVDTLARAGNYSELENLQTYISWVTRIPYGQYTEDNLDLVNAKATLDKYHHGLESVKTKILEFLSVIKLNRDRHTNSRSSFETGDGISKMKVLTGSSANAPVMLFIGIQGIGKTSMAKSIANALGRKFVRIALGGMASSQDLKGVSKITPDAEPGQIIKALVNTGVMNPLILLDELDKVSDMQGVRLDIMAALLEILDPEQNSTFGDRYIDFPIDLSKCLFITTANNIGGITSALLDRMEVIRFTSYNDEDKVFIARNYLLPKIRNATGIDEEQLKFDDAVWPLIIRPLGFDAGIRELERTLTNIARQVAKQIVEGKGETFTVSPENFRQYIPDDFGVYA